MKTSSPKPLKIPLFPLASGRQADERLGISIDQLTRPVPFRGIPHRHDFYHLFWIESGNGTFVSDGQSCPVTRGSLIFVPPGQVHAWEWNEALSGYVLCFEPALLFSGNDRPYRLLHDLAQLSAATKHCPTFQTAGSAYEMLQAAFKDLADESIGNAEFRGEMVRAQITALLIRLHRLGLHTPSAEAQGYSTHLTDRFLLLLAKAEGKLQRKRLSQEHNLPPKPRELKSVIPTAWPQGFRHRGLQSPQQATGRTPPNRWLLAGAGVLMQLAFGAVTPGAYSGIRW